LGIDAVGAFSGAGFSEVPALEIFVLGGNIIRFAVLDSCNPPPVFGSLAVEYNVILGNSAVDVDCRLEMDVDWFVLGAVVIRRALASEIV